MRTEVLNLLCLAALLCCPASLYSQDIAINETNFPDENFRNWVLQQNYGENGVLTESEIRRVTDIYLPYMVIKSLKGIEYFTALECLTCSDNQLTSLDLSKNTELWSLYCSGNQLTSLDVSKNTALKQLACDGNQLTSLDVSNNTKLTKLYCDVNQLTSLDVSKNTALTVLSCSANQLTSLDVSKNTKLRELWCQRNKIKGSNMNDLISSLRQNTTTSTYYFYVIDNREGDEGNVCTKSQVAAVKAKGWTPCYLDESSWSWQEYEGSDDEESILGDANGDGVVDVADVVAIVNYILEKPAENFNFKDADVNGDEVIDAADVVGVVNIILDKGNVNAARVRAVLRESGFIF